MQNNQENNSVVEYQGDNLATIHPTVGATISVYFDSFERYFSHNQALQHAKAMKVFGGVTGVAVGSVDVISASVNGALEDVITQAAGLGGSLAGSFAGAWAGAKGGAAVGAAVTAVNPLGIVAGGVIGGVIGGAVGGFAGEEIVEEIMNNYFDPEINDDNNSFKPVVESYSINATVSSARPSSGSRDIVIEAGHETNWLDVAGDANAHATAERLSEMQQQMDEQASELSRILLQKRPTLEILKAAA